METRLRSSIRSIQEIVCISLLCSSLTLSAQTKSKLKIGNCAITWGNDYFGAIHESAALGYTGIQLRGNVYKAHHKNPDSLRNILNQAKISMPIMSGSGLGAGKKPVNEEIEQLRLEAAFVNKLGGEFLQVVGPKREPENPPSKDELIAFARLMNRAGEIVKKEGIRLVFHNHMHDYGQTPEEIDIIAANIDAEKVGLLLDIAHCKQGGGDPTQVFNTWRKNIDIFHLKDVRTSDKKASPYNYIFTELGEGTIDLLPFFKALKASNFSGWAMVELDGVPEPGRTPKESAAISKKFLEVKVGLMVK